ncbi:MAG: hypothetical protein V1787_00045 [Candidatus Micrarchaeota archaeon]
MVEILQVVQGIVGAVLFFATGYLLSLAFFKGKDVDAVETAVYSIAFAILVPATVVFILNFGLGLPVFTTLGVYGVYIFCCAASIIYLNKHGVAIRWPLKTK